MTRGVLARSAVLALAASAAAPLSACSKDDATNAPKVRTLGVQPRVVRPNAAADESTDTPGTPGTPREPDHVVIETAEQPKVMYSVTVRTDAGPPKPDPDTLVLEQAREAASRCFTNISDGTTSRFASLHVVVLPSGSVNRSEVSAPTTHESWILSCLDGVASGLHFSEKPSSDIRNFTISVNVSRPR